MLKNTSNEMSIDLLRSLYNCDFDAGKITHKHGKRGAQNGANVGSVSNDGYRRVTYAGKSFAAHRVVWAMYYGEWPLDVLDHKDGNRDNNSIGNLRIANPGLNAANRKKHRNSAARLKGVSWHKKCKKWQSQVKCGNNSYYLGLFKTEEEANLAYARKATELFGDFARFA